MIPLSTRREEYPKEKVNTDNKHTATSYDGHYLMPAACTAIAHQEICLLTVTGGFRSHYFYTSLIHCGSFKTTEDDKLPLDKRRSSFNNRRGWFFLPSGILPAYQSFIIIVVTVKNIEVKLMKRSRFGEV